MSTKWVDVTAACRTLAASLSDATPTASVPGFSLFDAMSASELMDPKLDRCANLKGSIALNDVVVAAMPPAEAFTGDFVVRTCAHLLACEVSYLNGAATLETVNQCVLVWPQNWDALGSQRGELGRVLLAYCRDAVRSVCDVSHAVLTADVFEEEDFHAPSKASHAFDPAADTVSDVEKVITDLSSPSTSSLDMLSADQKAALRAIFALRAALSRLYASLRIAVGRAMSLSYKVVDALEAAQKLDLLREEKNRDIVVSCFDVVRGADAVIAAAAELEKLKVTAPKLDMLSETLVEDTLGAFTSVISAVSNPNPARVINVPLMGEALGVLKTVAEELRAVCRTVAGFYVHEKQTITYDLLLSWALSTSSKQLHIVTRSLQWGLAHSACSLNELGEMLIESMNHSKVPKAFLSLPLVTQWATRISKPAWESIKMLCGSRYRILTKLDQLMATWGKVAEEAAVVDFEVRSQSGLTGEDNQQWFEKWVLRQVVQFMALHMNVMAEMNLLSSFEASSFIWYTEYVASSKMWVLQKLRELGYILDRAVYDAKIMEAQALVKESKKNKKAASGKELKEAKRLLESAEPPQAPQPGLEEQLVRGYIQLMRGSMRLSVCLERLGLIRPPAHNEFTSLEFRFMNRYRCFHVVNSPPTCSLDDFIRTKNMVLSGESTIGQLITNASVCFQNAKIILDFIRKSYVPNPPAAPETFKYPMGCVAPKGFSPIVISLESEIVDKATALLKVIKRQLLFSFLLVTFL